VVAQQKCPEWRQGAKTQVLMGADNHIRWSKQTDISDLTDTISITGILLWLDTEPAQTQKK